LKDQGVIATLYADEVNVTYYAECLLPRITNSKFTGKVKDKGDEVVIAQRGTVTTSPYYKGMELKTQIVEQSSITLKVDRARYYRVGNDSIDIKQSHIMLEKEQIGDGVKRMAIDTETEFFADIYSEAHADNQGATAGAQSAIYDLGAAGAPLAVTKDNIVELVTAVRSVLGEQNANDAGMFLVMPWWARFLLMHSDLASACFTGDERSIQRSGRIGQIDDMTIYVSNLLYKVTDTAHACTWLLAGNRDAVTYCGQLTKSRIFEAQNTFGVIADGLEVYGWKVTKPEGLVNILAYKA
jgi:hypothetical protein